MLQIYGKYAGNANWIKHAERIRWGKICSKVLENMNRLHDRKNLNLVFPERRMCSDSPSATSMAYS